MDHADFGGSAWSLEVDASHVRGCSYARLKRCIREVVHMFLNPLSRSFNGEFRSNRHRLEMHVRRSVGGKWEMKRIAAQFVNRIVSDWKHNTTREAKKMVMGKRFSNYVLRCVSDEMWCRIVDVERKKLSGGDPQESTTDTSRREGC
eukprot:TRINITY_DN5577_c0_g4_i1.p1 TRINITY_DN5577_c0_g4~~TRINITY_DN5577_c0_g4_i1.p1  ORF type:complete len:147 (+),score=11.98 TRINITY_DN5577_c0_g4_i1:45-485(+)